GLVEKERHWQVAYLLDHATFTTWGHLPTVIAGDFNDWRNTLCNNSFAEHGFEQATVPARAFRSFPAFFALASLDKMFHRGGVEVEQARIVRTPLARRASDHLPLVVDFRIRPSDKGGPHAPMRPRS